MRWVLAFHIIFMVTWFSGLFYLPRLYVYHAMTEDEPGKERFKVMEHKLYYAITTPGGLLTTLTGFWLLFSDWPQYANAFWMHAKLILVGLLWAYHVYCGKLLMAFKYDDNRHGHVFYRWVNEFPTLILISVIILAIVQPFD